MASFEVATLLSLRDLATAPLQRFIALLKDAQLQLERTMGAVKLFQDAGGPGGAMLAAQRESLGLVQKEAALRADMAANMVRQSEAMLVANRESLAVMKQQLATQRAIGGGAGSKVIPAFNKAGNKLLWGGVGLFGGMAYATQKAIDFNQTALEVDMALGGYTRSPARRAADIEAIKRAAFSGSEATGFFNAQQILEGLKRAASAGARPLVEKMGMGTFTAIAPALAQYMDILGRLKGESAEQAATEAIQTAHQFGAYTPTAINKILNAQAALALLMPDKMSSAVNTGAYAASTGMNLAGMSPEAILALMATADQAGLGRGRAGARLKDYIEAIAVTQSKKREAAKRALGIRGAVGPDGNLDLLSSFDILIGDAKRMGPQAYRDAVRTAFGAQGAVVAAMFGDPKKRSMYEANKQVIDQALQRGDLGTIQNILKGGAAGQEAIMFTRLQNDIVKFGQYGLPIAVKFFDTINPKLKQFSDWADSHPAELKRMFDDMVKVGEGMLIVGGAFKVIAGLANAITVIKGVASGLSVLWGVVSKLPGPLKVVAAVLGVIYDDVKEFEKFKAQNFKMGPWDIFRESLGPLGTLLPRNNPFPHPSATAPATHRGTTTVHQTVHLSLNLPKGSDAATGRRVVAVVKAAAGNWHTAPLWSPEGPIAGAMA